MLMDILLGLGILAVGIFMTIKSEAVLGLFGQIEFFEKHLATSGGSHLGYKLIGLLFCFIGMLVATNLIGDFIRFVFSPLIQYQKQAPQ